MIGAGRRRRTRLREPPPSRVPQVAAAATRASRIRRRRSRLGEAIAAASTPASDGRNCLRYRLRWS